jgi:uncharacterized membrane protein (DUF106 family)
MRFQSPVRGEGLNYYETYIVVVIGVVISFILPIIRKSIPKGDEPNINFTTRMWDVAKPYLAILAASVLTAILIIAISGDHISEDWRMALIAGFAWDSTLQKVAV